MIKKIIDTISVNPEPKYPKSTQFLAQYINIANKYDIILGEYSLFKLKKLITLMENLKKDEILHYYYNDLQTSIKKISDYAQIPEQFLFLDLHESLQTPTVIENKIVTELTMNDLFKHMKYLKHPEEKRELLVKYYDQYFSKL